MGFFFQKGSLLLREAADNSDLSKGVSRDLVR